MIDPEYRSTQHELKVQNRDIRLRDVWKTC